MKRLAIFASGNGSNAQAMIEASRQEKWEEQVVLVVCDQPSAYVIERARSLHVPVLAISPILFSTKQEYETCILQTLHSLQVDALILAGYMRLIGPTILHSYEGKIVNVHPSLLPYYPGLQAIERAFEAGEEELGISIHLVDEGMDTGPILQQVSVPRTEGMTLVEMQKAIQAVEHEWYPKTVRSWLDDQKNRGGTKHEKASVN
ncbi:phosphoribosylglycinamide formyltransferase [Mangrovibacillus cuniculi]|uniref:Phosphoribosylglycinamide formyltransferase n=1 Tax=Mangrovibacillus cuniculi TaxID=2593652 RepID=A0A7S8C8Y8_9BACI|nr:phosphoribosylglycinamide formyltransferase [Mangrovibacillus cuniculi]QPC45491.1 phosphoribosylglycinamide formyltransferase [Mangrovibacillus cuniculi]